MYFNNDSAWRQAGLSSRSLSQLILLLLTTLTGQESKPAACHFSGEGRMREGMCKEKKKQREQPVCFPFEFFTCLLACARTRLRTLQCWLSFCFACVRFQVLACVVVCQPALHFYRKCLFCPQWIHSSALLLTEGFSASSQALSTSTLLRPQWLILTQAAVVSNQPSQPRT